MKLTPDYIKKRNNVNIIGDRNSTILFAHGFGCDQNMWHYITPAFKDQYKLVLFDYVGSGKSDLTQYNFERYKSLQGYAQDILEICTHFDLQNVIFVGHSVSCMIGLLAALERPDFFRDIIMIGPSPCYINKADYIGGFEQKDIEGLLETMEKNYIGWANFLAPNIMGNPERPHLSEELTNSFCSTDPVLANHFARTTFFSDNREDLQKLSVRSLVMQCSEDIIAPVVVGEYTHKNLQKSTFRLLKAKGHCPHMSEPEETTFYIKEYLSSRDDQS